MSDYETLKHLATAKAQELWDSFNANERAGVRFGMFPAKPMREATDAGHDSRLLSVALMDCAKNNGGMKA